MFSAVIVAAPLKVTALPDWVLLKVTVGTTVVPVIVVPLLFVKVSALTPTLPLIEIAPPLPASKDKVVLPPSLMLELAEIFAPPPAPVLTAIAEPDNVTAPVH